MMVHLNVRGDALVGKFRADGEIVQLGLLHPDRVGVEPRGQRIIYKLDGEQEHGSEDLLHIEAMSFDAAQPLPGHDV
jgi:phage portal protein BeeE